MTKTEISLLVEVPTVGRTTEQITTQLINKITGFHQEAQRRFTYTGYALKKAQVFPKEPGKCVLITDLVEDSVALRLREDMTNLWKEVANPMKYATSSSLASFELLVEELVDIGCTTTQIGGKPSYFWLSTTPMQKHPQVVEIGQELYKMGHNTLELMRLASDRIAKALGDAAAVDLSQHWHEIGLAEWQQGRGECWTK